jgi:small subunit ribosomal protein S4
MVRYTGPKLRIIRRLGLLPGLTQKSVKNRIKSPGQHGKIIIVKTKRSSLSDDYKERLIEKQKIRFNYGITEKQLVAYYKESKRQKGATGSILLSLLESRLDCIVFRLGFAPSIPAARQIINHGHILVNKQLVSIPSFQCYSGDIINAKKTEKAKKLISQNVEKEEEKRKLIEKRLKRVNFKRSRFRRLLPRHLFLDTENLEGKVLSKIKRSDVLLRVKDLKVIEYYSR